MRISREINKNRLSSFFIPALAVLFVFSLSLHNHTISGSITNNLDSNSTQSYSIEDCSACLLQGNLQVPEIEYSFNNNQLGQLIAFISIDFIVPASYLNLDKPSRSPPTI
jgi:hypothetical protein